MLTILHGDDTTASYFRLQELLSRYTGIPKIRLSVENPQMIYQELFSQDILGTQKVIIAQDLLSSKKIEADSLKNIPPESTVFFWEKKELPASILKKIPGSIAVQAFKPSPVLFKLLDTIGIDSKLSLKLLQQLSDAKGGVSWHIENRLFLLILMKMSLSTAEISEINGRIMQDWQLSKIQNQSKYIDLSDLKRLFSSTLKLEMMVKSGLANQDEKTLISLMLLKHS